MQVIIISGGSATGKSTLGKRLAKDLGITFLSKDRIKEVLFEKHPTHGYKNWNRLEQAGLEQLYDELETSVNSNRSCIIESNFMKADRAKLANLLHGVETKEIYCHTKGSVVVRRFIRRFESGTRHKGHGGRIWYLPMLIVNLHPHIAHWWNPHMLIDKHKVLAVDTTEPSTIDYKAIKNFLAS